MVPLWKYLNDFNNVLSAAEIKRLASQAGFHDCGVAKATEDAVFATRLHHWLQLGCQADMHYMEANEAMRSDPRLLLSGCQTVVSCVLAYKSDRQMQGRYKIAQYAYGPDYHETMKEMLWQLLAALQEQQEKHGLQSLQGRPFVDTAPISEKQWAIRAGLGWRGNNTLFVHPRYGSYVYLGELLLTESCDKYDEPHAEMCCGTCHQCVDACPNQALSQQVQPDGQTQFRLDARCCSSYNTIENRAETLSNDLHLAGYVFGCDCCQTVCPYNQQAPVSYQVDEQHFSDLEQLSGLSDETSFRKATKHTAITRIKFSQWLRNLRHEE